MSFIFEIFCDSRLRFCKTVNKSQIDNTFGAYFSFIFIVIIFQLISQNVDRIDGKTLPINPIEEI